MSIRKNSQASTGDLRSLRRKQFRSVILLIPCIWQVVSTISKGPGASIFNVEAGNHLNPEGHNVIYSVLIFNPPAEFRRVDDVDRAVALMTKCDTMNGAVVLQQDACGFEMLDVTLFIYFQIPTAKLIRHTSRTKCMKFLVRNTKNRSSDKSSPPPLSLSRPC